MSSDLSLDEKLDQSPQPPNESQPLFQSSQLQPISLPDQPYIHLSDSTIHLNPPRCAMLEHWLNIRNCRILNRTLPLLNKATRSILRCHRTHKHVGTIVPQCRSHHFSFVGYPFYPMHSLEKWRNKRFWFSPFLFFLPKVTLNESASAYLPQWNLLACHRSLHSQFCNHLRKLNSQNVHPK